MKYGLLVYHTDERNIGDYIQSIAAKRFLPKVDKYISREGLKSYVDEPTAIILNGWFMHNPEEWPPSDNVIPLIISFHISPKVLYSFYKNSSIEYLKKNGPVGCRDIHTEKILNEMGVDTYLSKCLTLTLEKKNFIRTDKNNIVLNDLLFNWKLKTIFNSNGSLTRKTLISPLYLVRAIYRKYIINKLIPKNFRINSISLTNELENPYISHNQKFEIANSILEEVANAKFVVTSRIHIALPAVAFGVPVIFLNNNLNNKRFDGIIEYFNIFTVKQIALTNKKKLRDTFMEYTKKSTDMHIYYKEIIEEKIKNYLLNVKT